MSSQNSSVNCGGSGFTSLLTIAFIILKLTGYIHWSWLWVLSPLWISMILAIFIIILVIIIAVIFNDN